MVRDSAKLEAAAEARRAAARAERRPRLPRLLLTLAGFTAILTLAVATTHYHVNRTARVRLFQRFAERIQPEIDGLGTLPELSLFVTGEWTGQVKPLLDDASRSRIDSIGDAVLVAVGSPSSPLLRTGRPVLVYDDGRIEAVWLSENAYQQRLDEQQRRLQRISELLRDEASAP